jgi:hypothetical protein
LLRYCCGELSNGSSSPSNRLKFKPKAIAVTGMCYPLL